MAPKQRADELAGLSEVPVEPRVAVANPCAICLQTDEALVLTFVRCTTLGNTKTVHLDCMAEAVALHPDRPLGCVLCRNRVPFGDADLAHLRARLPALVPVVELVDESGSLTSFRRRSLRPMALMVLYKVPVANDLWQLLFEGGASSFYLEGWPCAVRVCGYLAWPEL